MAAGSVSTGLDSWGVRDSMHKSCVTSCKGEEPLNERECADLSAGKSFLKLTFGIELERVVILSLKAVWKTKYVLTKRSHTWLEELKITVLVYVLLLHIGSEQ